MKHFEGFVFRMSPSAKFDFGIDEHVRAGFAPIAGGVDADHVGAELFENVDAARRGDFGNRIDRQSAPETRFFGHANGVLFAMIDQHPLRLDAFVIFQNAGDDRRTFVFVFKMWRVNQDQLIVLSRDFNLLLKRGDFISRIFIQTNFANTQNAGMIQQRRNQFDHFAREFDILRFFGVDAKPTIVINTIPGSTFGFDIQQVPEIIAETGGAGSVESSPESRLADGDDAATLHELIIVGGSTDAMNMGIDVFHFRDQRKETGEQI